MYLTQWKYCSLYIFWVKILLFIFCLPLTWQTCTKTDQAHLDICKSLLAKKCLCTRILFSLAKSDTIVWKALIIATTKWLCQIKSHLIRMMSLGRRSCCYAGEVCVISLTTEAVTPALPSDVLKQSYPAALISAIAASTWLLPVSKQNHNATATNVCLPVFNFSSKWPKSIWKHID